MKFTDNTQWQWYAEKDLPSQTVRLYNVGMSPDGKMKHRKFTEVKETVSEQGTYVTHEDSVTLALDYEEAQQVIQQLWDTGLRPNGVESSNEYVQSLKDHIKTLQSTVEHFMQMQVQESGDASVKLTMKVLEDKVVGLIKSVDAMYVENLTHDQHHEKLEKLAHKYPNGIENG